MCIVLHLSAEHRGSAGVAGGWPRSLIAWLTLTRSSVHRHLVQELRVHVALVLAHGHRFTTVTWPLLLLCLLLPEVSRGPLRGRHHVQDQGEKLSNHPNPVKSLTRKRTQKLMTQATRCSVCHRCLTFPQQCRPRANRARSA